MASSASISLQYRFEESWQTTWQLADDERQYSQPPPSTPVLPYIDTSLHIMGRTQMAQDKGIKAEFKQQHVHMHTRFDQVDKRFDQVDERLDLMAKSEEVDRRFDYVDKRFEQVDKQLDLAQAERSELREEIGKVKTELGQLRQDFEYRFQNIEARMINSKAFRPGARIEPIGKSIRGEFYPAPQPFPKTIRHFWHLRLPEERPTLVRLVHFYDIDITDWVTWDDDEDNSESESDEDDSSKAPPKTERAVDLYPERAIEEVADELGLDYERIQATMSRADAYQAPVFTPSNRKQSPITDVPRVTKLKCPSPPPRAPPILSILLKEMLKIAARWHAEQSQSPEARSEAPVWDNTSSQKEWLARYRQKYAPQQSSKPAETVNSEEKSEENNQIPLKQSEGFKLQEASEGSHKTSSKKTSSKKASSKQSEGSTIPISSEVQRAWENRSDR